MTKKERNSSIELLKIFAIIIICIGHVTLTLNGIYSYSLASKNFNKTILAIFHQFGAWGNSIFFICSAWFLLDSNKLNKRKWFNMLIEIWVVSMLILLFSEIVARWSIPKNIVIESIFPTTFGNNWYMTCYLLFYLIHPSLNKLIKDMNKTKLLRCTLILSFLYIFMNFINPSSFFFSMLILWVTLYFVMAYIKFYLKDLSNNKKVNLLLVVFGLLGYILVIIICNYVGLKNPRYSNAVLFSASNNNPFIIILSIGMFNLARGKNYKNKFINYISSLSMLIYIIHENVIMRSFLRVNIWQLILRYTGYSNIVLKDLIMALFAFIFGLLGAISFKILAEKQVWKISNKLFDFLHDKYIKIENKLLKIK